MLYLLGFNKARSFGEHYLEDQKNRRTRRDLLIQELLELLLSSQKTWPWSPLEEDEDG